MQKIDEEMLMQDVKNKGYSIESMHELELITKKEKDLVPVIIKHIKLVEPINLKEWLLGCIKKRGLYEASDFLLKEFKDSNDKLYQWSIGDALEIIKDPSICDELITIAVDKSYGRARERIVAALGYYKENIKIRKILVDLLEDKDVTGHALEALKKCGEKEDITFIEPYLLHKNAWIRKEAEQAIKQINKRTEKER